MLNIFNKMGASNSRNKQYQFWRHTNQPKELFSQKFTQQKLDYIHNNPVAAGIVESAADYLYSSARDYDAGRSVGLWAIALLDQRDPEGAGVLSCKLRTGLIERGLFFIV